MSRRVTLSLARGNDTTLQAVTGYACEQGLTPGRIPPEELFFSTVRA
jgi:hypothetical protein